MSGEKHPIRTGLIAAALGLLGLVQYFVPGGWGWVFTRFRQTATACVDWAGSPISVPAWLPFILLAIAVTAICAAASVVYKRPRERDAGIESITKAKIFGITWRWNIREGDICDIASFCPKCDSSVRPTMETRHGFIRLISYQCQCGAWRSQSFQCSQVEFIDRVYRTIQQEARKRPVEAVPRS